MVLVTYEYTTHNGRIGKTYHVFDGTFNSTVLDEFIKSEVNSSWNEVRNIIITGLFSCNDVD
jgi:hypothetical protein